MADAGSEQVDNEINLEQLKLLKEIFEAADEDGSGELDIDEFCAKLGPHLGVNLKPQQVAQLFMKIDADAGGTVDWEEFTNFMFLEKAQAGADEGDADNWRLFPADFRDTNSASSVHHEQVDKVYYCAAIDKYITCARDGTFRMWQAGDLDYVKSVNNGGSWITDCLYLPYSRKMVFTTMDRAITYYDIARGSYDLIGRVYASGSMGVPLTLHVLSGDAGERVVYGDSRGAAVLLLCGSRELPPRDLISTETHKDYIYLHKEHSDWITKIQWVPELGLVTSSLDATIKTFDINRERITHTCTHHTKGVHSFVWCHAYSCFASCGLERDVTVWHGTSGRKIGELRGHTSSVSHISLDPAHNHIFTLSLDKSIKVWDLRNHRCLQTITQDDWLRQSDSSPTCMMYDSNRCRLVTACHRPYVWQHKVRENAACHLGWLPTVITQDRTGHRDPVRGALYNDAFAVIVSVDEGATTCVWDLQDGAREGRFNANACSAAPCSGKDAEPCGPCSSSNNCVTAISFDKNQRRLVMGTNSGAVSVWNFNNGSLLRRFCHDQEPLEISEVLFAWDEKRSGDVVYAAGWNAKVFVWEDRDEDVVDSYKSLEGHRSDILAMAAYAPRQLLASGDYQGRIIIWGLLSGERKSWVTYRSQFAGGGNSWCGSSMAGTGKADLGLYSGCGSSTVECSVERLLWIPAFSPQQRQAASAAAAALTTSAAALAAGSSAFSGLAVGGSVYNAGAGAGASSAAGAGDVGTGSTMSNRQQQQQHPGLLSAFASSDSLLSDMSLSNLQPGFAQQQKCSIPSPSNLPTAADDPDGAAAADGSSSSRVPQDQQGQPKQVQQPQLGDASGVEVQEPDVLLLLATGGDSGVLLWHVDRLTQVTALCSLPGAVGAREVVTAAGLDEDATVVVLGDSTGHLRVLDISMGIDTSTPETTAASFKQRAHWQAHDGAIASVDLIPAKSSMSGSSNGSDGGTAAADCPSGQGRSSGQVLILTGSRDCNVAVWTLDGGLVGVLGEHSWDLDDPSTWQDPQGLAKRPPKLQEQLPAEAEDHEILGEEQQAFASMAGGRVGGTVGGTVTGSGNSSSSSPGMLTSSGSRRSHGALTGQNKRSGQTLLGSKANGAAAVASHGIAAHKGSKQAGPHQHPQQLQQDDQLLPQQQQQQLSAELGGLSLASLIMQERKQKQREAMVTTSPQPHCQLRVHQLADINTAAGPGLRAASDAKHKQHTGQQTQQQHKSHSVGSSRHTAAGGRHLGSRPSGASSSWSGWTGV